MTIAASDGAAWTVLGGPVETVAVAVIVAIFAWRALRQLAPWLHRRLVDGLRRRLGLKVVATDSTAAGCGSGCSSCNNCGTGAAPGTAEKPANEEPLAFKPRKL